MTLNPSSRVGIVSFLLALTSFYPVLAADLRDPEALYVPEKGIYPIELTLKKTAAVYGNRSLQGHLRNFVKGEEVTLVAYHPNACLVRNHNSGFEGWVATDNLSPIPPKVVADLKTKAKEEKRFAEAIEDKNVIAGMSFDHVDEILGKPDEESFRKDASGRHDIWIYIEYDSFLREQTYRDRATGQIYRRFIREKIPESETRVEFTNGAVSAVESVRLR